MSFWFAAARPVDWFRRSAAFDARVRQNFAVLHDVAAAGAWPALESFPRGALAFVIVLDQFSRNLHRDDPRAFSSDPLARAVARRAIARRFDLAVPARERAFFYMPFMHAETIADQDLSLRLFRTRRNDPLQLGHAREHASIILRFGRFPHRNAILGRASTPAERQFLRNGGFAA
ncbi:MAG: DUF924 family protein [Alphaproteobacteria bacterium]|nr:DUF924 family protein [Alphaproteobacteria bacterium]